MARKEVAPLKAEVVARMMNGESQTEAAAAVGIHKVTISRWKNTDPQFRNMTENLEQTADNMTEIYKHEGKSNVHLREAANIHVLRYQLQRKAADAITVLADLLGSDDERIRLSAAKEILDRTGLIRSTEVIATAATATAVQPTSLAQALEFLGMAPEDAQKALPVDIEVTGEASTEPGEP